ncbi:apolipoprotein N-acyltransferase [Altererythrobacter soli]|uniref:Apolipoprotein N-acyltransferase n=1 Tax=Croceibacterium soli TaxID=1739690 RepID=A0A6I4UPN1_9SPHN|nr:apolipoprotein N-acyltransferase [Croceibacterium soli]MXP40386.1 apolipoprotein N-acyltransferase [Croceibacterium soli]
MTRIERAIEAVLAHPRIVALLLGVVAATGFRPLSLWPLALLAMGGLLILIARAPDWRRAALLGWIFGVGHFTFGNSWIATAFTYQANMPAVLGWIAVPLLSLYLAVYPALASAGSKLIGGRGSRTALLLAFAGCWIVAEWLRSWVFTGYAWNPFGIVLLGPFDRPGLAALAPWMGTYALSGIAVLIGSGLVLALSERRWVAAGAASLLLMLGMYLPVGEGAQGTLPFTLVQPDVRQEQLDEPRLYEANFQKTAALSRPEGPSARRLVLWPESGLPDYLREGYPQRYYLSTTAFGDPALARRRIGQVIGEGGLLLTGAVDLEIEGGRAVGAYNAVTAVAADGAIVGGYRKAHLVPYGEYLALRWLFEPLGLTRLVPGAFDFIPGPGPRTLDSGAWGQAGVQICYEIIFSGQVVDPDKRPDYIFNPSNDGWFGAFGPPQHLAQARLRSIEEALPVLRATTTGISAVIDSRGVVRSHVPMRRADRIDGHVPPPGAPTLFSRLGNILPLAWALAFLAASRVVFRRRRD